MEANKAFAEKYSFPFLLLSDTARAIGMAYHAARTPDEPAARRISYLIGPDGKIKIAYGKVNAQEHPEQVLADLG